MVDRDTMDRRLAKLEDLLRRLRVHLYLEVDHDALFGFVERDLDQLERFAAAVQRAADDGAC